MYKRFFRGMLISLVCGILISMLPVSHTRAEEPQASPGITQIGSLSGSQTEAGYRMEPLKNKIKSLTAEDIERTITGFKDLAGHWGRMQTGKLLGLGIVSGVGNGRFNPDDALQADQFIKMLVRSLGFNIAEGSEYWAKPYIETAIEYGIVLEGEFSDYTKAISRENTAKLLMRAALLAEDAPDQKYAGFVTGKIKDYAAISDGCKQSVIDTYMLGLIIGSEGKFDPRSGLKRAEAAAVIVRLLDEDERKPVLPGPDEVIRTIDNRYNPIELYPGAVPETFYVAKAAQDAIPKAKGYVDYFYNPKNGIIFVVFYKDKAARDESIFNQIGSIDIAYGSRQTYAYNMSIDSVEIYKELFTDYTHELFKAIFNKDAEKAITLHDKYMNMQYMR